MIFKGVVQKFETLSDGSLKLSISLPKEMKDDAVKLTYQTVYISEAPESEQNEAESWRLIAQQATRIADAVVELGDLTAEVAQKYGVDIDCSEQKGVQEGLTSDSPIPDTSEDEMDDSSPISQMGENESENEEES